MVSRRDSGSGSVATASSPFLFGSSSTFSSSSPFDSSSSSSTTTTHFFNVLSANAGGELTTVQHYNDIIRSKNTNMDSKNLNPEVAATALVVLSKDCPKNRWGSFRDRSSSFMESTRCKITNKTRAMDKLANKDSMANQTNDQNERQIDKLENIIIREEVGAEEKPLNIKENNLQRDQSVIHIENAEEQDRVPNTIYTPSSAISRGTSLKEKFLSTRDRLTTKDKAKRDNVSRTKSLVPLSLKRNRFWSSIDKSIDPTQRRKAGQERTARVPKLHIWLSTDQAPRELSPDDPPPILNNTRDNVPRIQLDHPRVIYRSVSEGNRWRAGGAAPDIRPGVGATYHRKIDTQPSVDSSAGGEILKSPVGKQPTWPLSYNTSLLSPRPKLIHQDKLNAQASKRAELGRQDAVMEEADAAGEHARRKEDVRIEWQNSGGSVDNSSSPTSTATHTLSPSSALAAPNLHPRLLRPSHSLGVARILSRKSSMEPTRSASDDKSDVSEYSWRSDSMMSDLDDEAATQSVFSLGECPATPAPSWGSSSFSLHRQDTTTSRKDQQQPSEHALVSASNSLQVYYKHGRSNSTTERSAGQTRLTVPAGETNKSRRPSLMSLRSLTRSPIPYISMDYDPDYEYEYAISGAQGGYYGSSPYYHGAYGYGGGGGPMEGLIPEAAPKLTLTQRLAFPNLVQNSLDRPRPRDPFSEENNGMNTAAKLITVLVLTMVTVLVIVGIYKILH